MITFFGNIQEHIFAVATLESISTTDQEKLIWLFGNVPVIKDQTVSGAFIGPRATMITPWSTNAVEITQNMGITGIQRIEKFLPSKETKFDPMLMQRYEALTHDLFTSTVEPEPIRQITDIATYNQTEGLALNTEEITYLNELSIRLGRPLTDTEVFGFSQVNSEHCRHKIFNGSFIIDNKEKEQSLFQLIKETAKENPNGIVSAYKDNVAFVEGPEVVQFAPERASHPDFYKNKNFKSVLSLKAETHNFPTTVEPFNGAATGSGGEIRDRLAGGTGSIPLAGTAVYMTAYPRTKKDRIWESEIAPRPWLYQSPLDILIKASNGASDFGNKFGQPLISGSILTFEHAQQDRIIGYDKVIMQAGGIGYGKLEHAQKREPKKGDKIVVLGGDNYRIGMGGAAVSSADTGAFASGIELNAVQRSNPEMQKRVANAIRGLVESSVNPVVSIHDHGAGGHLNCLSELVEDTGGIIHLNALPVGDPTLSAKEIIGNESQERMGLIVAPEHLDLVRQIAERERAPMYVVGEVTGDHRFTIKEQNKDDAPLDLKLSDMFGSSPKTVLTDQTVAPDYSPIEYDPELLMAYLKDVLKLEAVACKDWLTNKVDRCVGGRVAKQQCAGPLQLPLNNCGVMALDFVGKKGVATSIGHAPIAALIDPAEGSRIAITKALSNLIWAPLEDGLKSVSLSANWMWPCRNPGEDARLYAAVDAVSEFAISLGINVPTGKDSLSMKQKYRKQNVLSPGTVIISSVGACSDITKVVEPVLQLGGGSIIYIPMAFHPFALGGSSFAQTLGAIGAKSFNVKLPFQIKNIFNTIQDLIKSDKILAGHDVAAGGLITTLLEMCFADQQLGADINLRSLKEPDTIKLLFSENCGLVIQAADESVMDTLTKKNIPFFRLGTAIEDDYLHLKNGTNDYEFNISQLRDHWYETSFLMDQRQSGLEKATERFNHYKKQPLRYKFPENFSGVKPELPAGAKRPIAAILREKGSNSEREMANALYMAGFDVKDVHTTDLISGRENLEDVQFLGAVGGFSNSDVLGSAKGWAGALKYNEKARMSLENFFKRPDVLSVGICNGCQLFLELDLFNAPDGTPSRMTHNDSHKHESAFTSVTIAENNSVMLSTLAGTRLGIWISHGEGKFSLPLAEDQYQIVGKYGYDKYPANPNGSDYNAAMIASPDGRHLATMPHFERSIFPWNWAHYPGGRKLDEVSPWLEAFVNARNWILAGKG